MYLIAYYLSKRTFLFEPTQRNETQPILLSLTKEDFKAFEGYQRQYLMFDKILLGIDKHKGAYKGLDNKLSKVEIYDYIKLFLIRDLVENSFNLEKYRSKIKTAFFFNIVEHIENKYGFSMTRPEEFHLKKGPLHYLTVYNEIFYFWPRTYSQSYEKVPTYNLFERCKRERDAGGEPDEKNIEFLKKIIMN